mgnify:CR=1 FL=1
MQRSPELSNISRIDQEPKVPHKVGLHGWWVRFQRDGNKFHHFFNDNKYDGKDGSLEAAKLFRDAVKSQYYENPNTELTLSGKRKANRRNVSGATGVNRSYSSSTKKGKRYKSLVWQAHWPIGNGKHKGQAFSVNKYGEEEAFQLALKARKEGLAAFIKACHPALLPPENSDQKIWRYLDFTKFISMLEDNALFFSCVSKLNDSFEGSFTKINKTLRPIINKKNGNKINNKTIRDTVAVNCWHLSDYESAAMWELYSKSNESVCIQSTYYRFASAIQNRAVIGLVQYLDYKQEYIPENDPYLVFLHKRKSFEHEREIRAIIKELDEPYKGNGKNMKIDLVTLIDKIYISPNAPAWFSKLVKNTVKRYGLTKQVMQSSLADDPIY